MSWLTKISLRNRSIVGLVVVALALLARVRQRLGRSLARIAVDGTPAPV